MAFIFAKKPDANLASLVKALDTATAKNKIKLVVNFTGTPSDDYVDSVKALAKKHGLKNAALTLSRDGSRFKVNKEADVTVMHYRGKKVKFNFAAKGKISEKEIAEVVKGLSKLK